MQQQSCDLPPALAHFLNFQNQTITHHSSFILYCSDCVSTTSLPQPKEGAHAQVTAETGLWNSSHMISHLVYQHFRIFKIRQELITAFQCYFLVIGCPLPLPPEGATVEMTGDMAEIMCNNSHVTFHLVCDGNQWTGPWRNCTEGKAHRSIIGSGVWEALARIPFAENDEKGHQLATVKFSFDFLAVVTTH